ncbi:XRE family transcriptional regulator [Paenibacillus sp. FSL L8-0663]|uniref:XRE family transcriptional regulator n=1 Tax=Paenibacillus sp. FSL L8-0663 TaxID=2921606 RepID=UPI0030FB571B
MNNKMPVTSFGWAIKQRLVELRLDQKTFCETHNIPPSRLSNLIHGTRKAQRYRKQVAAILNIDDKDYKEASPL